MSERFSFQGRVFEKVEDGSWVVTEPDCPPRPMTSTEWVLFERSGLMEAEFDAGWGKLENARPGTAEHALIGWRSRCLKAERRLEDVLAELGHVRDQLTAAKFDLDQLEAKG